MGRLLLLFLTWSRPATVALPSPLVKIRTWSTVCTSSPMSPPTGISMDTTWL